MLAKRKRVKYCERVKLRKLQKTVKQIEQEKMQKHEELVLALLKTEIIFQYSKLGKKKPLKF